MRIVVDAFGGDNAPLAVLQGCQQAVREYDDIEIILTGDEKKIRACAKENDISLTSVKICHANNVIGVEEDPLEIRRLKRESSMAVGMTLLRAGEGDAFVSAGSTGALVVGNSTIVGRIHGIKRTALAPILPSKTGCFMLLDAGANLECRPEMLLQFAIMGSEYVSNVLGVVSPRVGLANVGAEASKGTQTLQEAYQLLSDYDELNFIGNVEARDIPLGVCDVVVADGLSGNMILKTMEGTCNLFVGFLKEMFFQSTKTKMAAFLMKGQMKKLKKRMDYTEYGGAVLIGSAYPVIKAHGSSDAKAFKNAIRQAKKCVQQEITEKIIMHLKKDM